MSKSIVFWAACAIILFALQIVVLRQGIHRQNWAFAMWLYVSVSVQLAAAWGLAGHEQRMLAWLGRLSAVTTLVLAGLAIVSAYMRISEPANRSIALAFGAMLAFDAACWTTRGAAHAWCRNISCFGPTLFLLITFSGIRLDMLPLLLGHGHRAAVRAAGAFFGAVTQSG